MPTHPSESLFVSTIDHKKGAIILNKRHIVSAVQVSATDTEIKMSSGDVFHTADVFGTLSFNLLEVSSKETHVR